MVLIVRVVKVHAAPDNLKDTKPYQRKLGSRRAEQRQNNGVGSYASVLFWVFPFRGRFDAKVHLSMVDVTVVVDSSGNPKQLQIRLKRSKTDQLGEGSTVCVGKTGEDLCPIAATLSWLVERGNAGGPLFHYADESPLTQHRFVVELRKAREDPQRYGGHSFRSGTATVAAEQGIGDATIKLLGRWRSSAYQRYIKITPANLASYSRTLLKSTKTHRNHGQ